MVDYQLMSGPTGYVISSGEATSVEMALVELLRHYLLQPSNFLRWKDQEDDSHYWQACELKDLHACI